FVLIHCLRPILVDGNGFIFVHGFSSVAMDGDGFIIIHRLGPGMLDVGSLVVIDGFLAVVSNPMGIVVLDFDVLIFFGLDEELFAAFFVFETDFVEIVGAAAFAGVALDATLGFV